MQNRDMELDEMVVVVGGKSVCPYHVTPAALKTWVRDNADADSCDYCWRTSDTPIAASVFDLVELVFDSLQSEWGHADDIGVPWEGGYMLAEPLSTEEVLTTEGDEQVSEDDELVGDLARAIGGDAWVSRGFLVGMRSEHLRWAWETLSEIVKHRQRFFFLRREANPRDPEDIASADLLAALGDAVIEVDLIRTLEAEPIYRGRTHQPNEQPSTLAALGAPPKDQALSANRMSPAGISMFYGAFDAETAAAEARGAEPDPGRVLTIGTFRLKRPLHVVDLSAVPEVPSLFDAARRHLRTDIIFLRRFTEDLRKPVTRDRTEHVEYTPTQAACEWFRDVFRPIGDDRLDGILYPSARREGGVSCGAPG